jgi:hypothetical protein
MHHYRTYARSAVSYPNRPAESTWSALRHLLGKHAADIRPEDVLMGTVFLALWTLVFLVIVH